jgi:hypothetical protein
MPNLVVIYVPLLEHPQQSWNCAFLKMRSSIPAREINVIRNPARFWSKATAAVSEIACAIVAERLRAAGVTGR